MSFWAASSFAMKDLENNKTPSLAGFVGTNVLELSGPKLSLAASSTLLRTRHLSFLSGSGVGLIAHPFIKSKDGGRRQERRYSTVVEAATTKAAPKVSKEVQTYWDTVLEGVDKPTAKKLLSFIDTSFPLGLPMTQQQRATAGTSSPSLTGEAARQGRGARPPLYSFFTTTKTEHPTKVLLVRVGEFYESVGIDAVLLVQHAGLNPMGSGDPPRAGCPRQNLRRTVTDLVENAGLSVVVCEEAPEPYSYGRVRNKQKQRYVAAVVTPAAPHLLHGLVDEDSDVILYSAPPLLGVSPTVSGYTLVEVDAELRTVAVTEQVSEEFVYSKIEGGIAPPLFIHLPAYQSDTRLTEATAETEWEKRVGNRFRNQVGMVVRYGGTDAVQGMLDNVRQLLGLSATEPFTMRTTATDGSGNKSRPRPVYYSTAANLGLHKTRGVPSLLDYVLPMGAPLVSRRWMRKLLLLPPPAETALAIQSVCRELKELREPVPEFPVMSSANVVLKLRTREANDTFFRELASLVRSVEAACTLPGLKGLSEALLIPTAAETGIRVDRETLRNACRDVLQEIHTAIHHDESYGMGIYMPTFVDSTGTTVNCPEPLLRMFQATEDYKGKIKVERLPEVFQRVDEARRKLHQVLTSTWITVQHVVQSIKQLDSVNSSSSSSSIRGKTGSLYYDVSNNAVWMKIPAATAGQLKLEHPRDRNGKVEIGAYSTPEIEAALDDYRLSCAEASTAVREELRAVAERLTPFNSQLVCASTFAVIAAALDCHVREAARLSWILPTLNLSLENNTTSEQGEERKLVVSDAWPYWLDTTDNKTVKNSFTMSSMFLLTGPNMAGKSTILRTLCAVALLGSCGLHVPAAAATLPYIDAFMLRNFSADSPLEGRSSFAVEMTEMRYLLEDATANSLVLIDELGKGTEVKAGAALAGAMLEKLDSVGCMGVFATHLHVLLDIELEIPSTEYMYMETAISSTNGDRQRVLPTWRMVPGISTESLALDVAYDTGIDSSVLTRAEELHQRANNTLQTVPYQPVVVPLAQASVLSTSDRESDDSTTSSATLSETNIKTLDEAASILQSTATSFTILSTAELAVSALPPGFKPHPRTVGASCVYIARRRDGRFYVGSTDSLLDRVSTHRKKGSQVGDPQAEFVYIALSGAQGGSSMARSVETAVIKAMVVAGFPMVSTSDARRKHKPNMGDS